MAGVGTELVDGWGEIQTSLNSARNVGSGVTWKQRAVNREGPGARLQLTYL